MSIIQTTLTNTIDEFRINTNNLSTLVGDGEGLSGYNSIISAITSLDNEFNTNVGSTDAILAVKSVLSGAYDWDMSLLGSDSTEPTSIVYALGTGSKSVKINLTWINGNVTSAEYQYSSNYNGSTGTFNTVLTETITYNANGDVITIIWS